MAKVLVLDDDRLSQKLVGKVFGNAGHETLAAFSAQHAWEKLHEHVLVDMVVLDNQLDQEWGWQFMRALRANPAYLGLPVVVYTAHTERDSIVRYLELGVQSMNLKPYQSDVLLVELGKAIQSNWSARVMEPPETVCERMNFSLQDYCSLLATANRTIAERQQVALARLTSPNNAQLFAALDGIEQQCRTVGIVIVDGVIEKIKKGVNEQDLHGALEGFKSVDSFLGMIRHRMLAVMKMGDSVARTPLSVARPGGDPAGAPEPSAPSFAASYGREIINRPLWHYGRHFAKAMRHPFVTPEELLETSRRMGGSAPFTTVAESVKLLQSIPTMSMDDAVAVARETRGFVPVYQFILDRVTGTDNHLDTAAALTRAAGQQGIARLLTLACVARVANSLPRDGLLNLRQLYAHSFSSTLNAFEIGRLLKLDNDFMLSVAGLTHDVGRWLFGLGEPGAYALALAVAEDDQVPIEKAEVALMGVDHHEAGRQLLSCMGQPDLMQKTALLHHDPGKVTEPEFLTTITVTHLAHQFAQAAVSGPGPQARDIIDRILAPDCPAWPLLKSRGVVLPLDVPELVDTLVEIANTSNWIAHQLLGNASSAAPSPAGANVPASVRAAN